MNRYPYRNGIGASSILMIITVICLTTFSVLALLTARNDLRLTERTTEATALYYHADAQAQHTLMQIDQALLAGGSPEDVEGVSALSDAHGEYAFSAETNDGRANYVVVSLKDTGKDRYRVVSYRVIQTKDWGCAN